ncbi:uncharacterized protein LOC119610730 [Lucilia sericata]|uniref:uncharacterized protein LOC119610730 n=1 Tax=Lucilia sericata TaxID=13632 RepID=UPI0018A83958|nr:uncharacterized protein LOC119610730 [Lucilia sericata]
MLAESAVAIAEKISMEYKYNEEHRGPFIVYVDAVDPSGSRKPINAISLNRTLKKYEVEGITEVLKIGYGRCKVTFKLRNLANNFAYDKRIKQDGYLPKIFAHFVSKIGLIFDIPTDLSMEDFQSSIISEVPILKCIRVERKDPEDRELKIPTGRVKIFFDGLEIPKEISYDYTKIKVKHYISFAQCYRCYRFNHFAQHCKQQMEVCRICFNKHEQAQSCGQMMCTNCKNDHHPTSKSCPARIKAYTIKKIMTLENLSINEARTKYSGAFGNRFAVLDDEVEDIFPRLTPKSNSNIINNGKEAAKTIHSIMPYSAIVRRNPNREREAENSRQNMEQWQKFTKDSNYVNNKPNTNFNNPHKTSSVEKLASQLNVNTAQSESDKVLSDINSKLDGFLAGWENYNLSFDQKEFLRGLQNQIIDSLRSKEVTP